MAERVQLTDAEIDALDKRLLREGHNLSAGTMRVVELMIQARLEVQDEVQNIQERTEPRPSNRSVNIFVACLAIGAIVSYVAIFAAWAMYR